MVTNIKNCLWAVLVEIYFIERVLENFTDRQILPRKADQKTRGKNQPKSKLQGGEGACWATDGPWLVLPPGICHLQGNVVALPPWITSCWAADWQSLGCMPWPWWHVGRGREGFQHREVQYRFSLYWWRCERRVVGFLNLYAKYLHWLRWKTRVSQLRAEAPWSPLSKEMTFQEKKWVWSIRYILLSFPYSWKFEPLLYF